MGMSFHVVGFTPPDETWQKHKAVWDACTAAGVPVPDEVARYFDYSTPDPAGVEVRLEEQRTPDGLVVTEWRDEYGDGFEVHLDRVPEHVKTLRFFYTV